MNEARDVLKIKHEADPLRILWLMRKLFKIFIVYPVIKIFFLMVPGERIKCGKLWLVIMAKNDWDKRQKTAFIDCMTLLVNELPEKYISMISSKIKKVYIGAKYDTAVDYHLINRKMPAIMIFYKEGYTDNPRYLSSLLVRCAIEKDKFELPKKERHKIGRLAQVECLSNFSGEDIDFFRNKLLALVSNVSTSSKK
jgi:hypothetical protein